MVWLILMVNPLKDNRVNTQTQTLDVLLEWKYTGIECVINNNQGCFPAIKLDSGVFQYNNTIFHDHPVVCILTKELDEIYLTKLDGIIKKRFVLNTPHLATWDEALGETFFLSDLVQYLYNNVVIGQKKCGSCSNLIFPMIDY